MANSIMQRHPEAWTMREFKQLKEPEWGYPYSLVLYGFQKLYLKTGDEKYLAYAKTFVDQLIDEKGKIHGYAQAEFNIDSSARADAPGVYVQDKKIASVGLRLKNQCCYHGISLNVNMDLSPFNAIDPCGYKGLEVTQLKDLGVELPQTEIESKLLKYLTKSLNY